jgi:hypothetical protein
MIPIRAYEPPDAKLAARLRDMEAAIDALQPKRATFRWNSASAPVRVLTTLTRTPSSVHVESATADGGATKISGAAITWSYDGQSVIVSAIGTLSSSTDYDVVLTFGGNYG